MAAAAPFPPHAALPGPGQAEGARGVRTALTVQAREGLLFVYIPPLPSAEDWLSLVAGVERAAAALVQGIVLEGYKAPYDRRLDAFSVTPDPGVIEVNVHPATDWDEIVEHTEQLYEQARQCGLRAEKFMMDGRHVGTGGGNHVVMGAARRRIAHSCAGRTCCARCWASGKTIRVFPSCSAACSSDR